MARDTAFLFWKPGVKSKETSSARSQAFEDAVLEHTDMLYAVALRLTRNPTEAEDLTQNALVKALRFHDKFREGTYIKAWLLTILRNTFINEYRRRARRPHTVELSGTEPSSTPTLDPEVRLELDTTRREHLFELLDDAVRKALDALPPDFREAVIMADLEDRSYKDIAEHMGCPIGTVMSRLFRGRKLLREQLADHAQHYGLATPERTR